MALDIQAAGILLLSLISVYVGAGLVSRALGIKIWKVWWRIK